MARALLWLTPSALALALTCFQIGRPVMWEDELTTWEVAIRPLGGLVATLTHVDAALGGYYLMMHAWIAVAGASPAALRLPSALAVAAAAGFIAACGRRLFGAPAGLTAGVLFAFIPTMTRYGQEARPYALVVCAVAASTLLFLRAVQRPESARRWVAYSAAIVVIGLLNVLALTALAGHVVSAVLYARVSPAVKRRFWVSLGAGLLCLVPVEVAGLSQVSNQLAWVPRPTLSGLVGLWPQLYDSSLICGAVMICAVMAWRGSTPTFAIASSSADEVRFRAGLWLCTGVAVIPPLILWVVSHGSVSYFFYRYMIFTVPGAVLLAAHAIAFGRSRAVCVAVIAALALISFPDQGGLRNPFSHFWHGVDYQKAANVIAANYQPGDAVVYERGSYQWLMLDTGVTYYLPRNVRLRDEFEATSAAQHHGLQAVECADPAACFRAAPRIWLVTADYSADPFAQISTRQAAVLRGAHYATVASEAMAGIEVTMLKSTARE